MEHGKYGAASHHELGGHLWGGPLPPEFVVLILRQLIQSADREKEVNRVRRSKMAIALWVISDLSLKIKF